MEVPFKLELVAMATVLIKLGISLHSYSGKNRPPMFGDYEAQRHWMEVTVNLQLKDWYQNTTDNDLLYWGLDYPPLTAYHSYVTGLIAQRVDSRYVELHTSRGYESPDHQFFMRMSVLVSDLLIFTSALYCYVKGLKVGEKYRWVFFALCSHPGLALVDYGHFQYNSVSLGLALWAVVFLSKGLNVWAAVAFTAAINFKQMELYHALPFFFYLLAVCRRGKGLPRQVLTLAKIGIATIASFILIWYPFLRLGDGPLLRQVVTRIFPFDRGVFEDYVANFWCCLNVLVKIRRLMDAVSLARCCLLLTALFSLPCSIHLYARANIRNLLVCLINVSMAFFLFSYHVHEKSILLVALPVSLIGPYMPMTSFWFLCIAHFSMLPLYVKDGILLPALAVVGLYGLLAHSSLKAEQKSVEVKYLVISSAAGCVILTVAYLFCPTPAAYPYLWTLLVSVWSFLHFAAFFVYFLWLQLWAGAHCLKVKQN